MLFLPQISKTESSRTTRGLLVKVTLTAVRVLELGVLKRRCRLGAVGVHGLVLASRCGGQILFP